MTSTTLLEERVLKTDVLGRVKTPPERREALLDEFEKSGMSGTKFAQFIGVKYQTWASWVQRRRRQRAVAVKSTGAEARTLHFLEAVVPGKAALSAERARAGLRVVLPGGGELEVTTREQAMLAGELLRVLGNHQGSHPC